MPQIKPLYIGLIAIHAPCVLCVVYIVCAYIPRVWYIPVCNNIINVPCRCVTQPFFLSFFFLFYIARLPCIIFSPYRCTHARESSHIRTTLDSHDVCTSVCRILVCAEQCVSIFNRTGRPDRTVYSCRDPSAASSVYYMFLCNYL